MAHVPWSKSSTPVSAENFSEFDSSVFKRSDAQLIIARLYGFQSWPGLRDYLNKLGEYSRPDIADDEPTAPADRFAALACVTYGEYPVEGRIDQANELLVENPSLADSTIAAMAAVGNHRLLAEELDRDPGSASDLCGPTRWPPILYCTYSRVATDSESYSGLETARLLLDRGADPNAGFLWRGLVPPFTALTGVFGRGEQDQPPHRDRLGLARLLLEAGADPNDGQTLYNNGLGGSAHDDPAHLELLVEFGLGQPQTGPWYERFGSRLTAPSDLLYDELEVAAHRGLVRRMRFLINLDLDLDRGVGRSGMRPADLAQRNGHNEIVAVLAEAGVRPSKPAGDTA